MKHSWSLTHFHVSRISFLLTMSKFHFSHVRGSRVARPSLPLNQPSKRPWVKESKRDKSSFVRFGDKPTCSWNPSVGTKRHQQQFIIAWHVISPLDYTQCCAEDFTQCNQMQLVPPSVIESCVIFCMIHLITMQPRPSPEVHTFYNEVKALLVT